MYRSSHYGDVEEEAIELLPTSVPTGERTERYRIRGVERPAMGRGTGAFALVVILVFALLLPSPLSWSSSESPPRNGTHPLNSTYYPFPGPLSLQGKLERATRDNRELTSSIFVPFPVRECTITTPAWFAPCAAKRTLIPSLYAEELLYPDFGLALPTFAKEEQRKLWLEAVGKIDRMRYEQRGKEEYMLYRGQHGQNYVLHNVSFIPPSMDSWVSTACGVDGTSLRSLAIQPLPSSSEPSSSAVLVSTPDSWSFQHFLDRATHVVGQARHLLFTGSDTFALTGRAGSKIVQEMWTTMGFAEKNVVHHPRERMELAQLVFACKSVLIHPYLSWRSAEMLGMPWAKRRQHPFDTSSKKVVMYMSRSDGRASNGGRRVLNEDSVLTAIRSLLDTRGRGERLELFDPTKFENVSSLIETFSRDVAAVVGPHGGSLMNHRFAGPDTLVLEFLPTTRMEVINFEETSMLNQTYAVIVTPGVGATHDVEVDAGDVVKLLSEKLGKPGKSVLMPYQWVKE